MAILHSSCRVTSWLGWAAPLAPLPPLAPQVPQDYLADNWPVRLSALSPDGAQLALCGARGVCLYNDRTKRWRVFGDVTQERLVRCVGLLWFGPDVLVVFNSPTSSADDDAHAHAQHTADSAMRGHAQRTGAAHASVPGAAGAAGVQTAYHILLFPKSHLDQASMLLGPDAGPTLLPACPVAVDLKHTQYTAARPAPCRRSHATHELLASPCLQRARVGGGGGGGPHPPSFRIPAHCYRQSDSTAASSACGGEH